MINRRARLKSQFDLIGHSARLLTRRNLNLNTKTNPDSNPDCNRNAIQTRTRIRSSELAAFPPPRPR